MNLLDKVIGKDIEIKTDLADGLSCVRADPTQVEQVLMNLCINSRDAMPSGGRISIETHNADFSEKDARCLAGVQCGRFAELRVTDTGTGMDASTREKIFEPFFTTKGTGKGTGLGLATVYGIVKQHNGFIQVESEPGQGSTFRIFLPVNEEPVPDEFRSDILEDLTVRGGSETILLADDHEGIREMAQSVLTARGYRVLLANDGEEAIEIFRANRDHISLVLLDVIMPRRSGPEVFAAVKALRPGISVIFATGYSNETAMLADLVMRGVPLLRKPYTPSVLCRRSVKSSMPRCLYSFPYRMPGPYFGRASCTISLLTRYILCAISSIRFKGCFTRVLYRRGKGQLYGLAVRVHSATPHPTPGGDGQPGYHLPFI